MPLSDEQKDDEVSKMLNVLDEDGDGCMSFDEFAEWFRKTTAGEQALQLT